MTRSSTEVERIGRETDLERGFPEEDREPTLVDYALVIWGGRWLILALVTTATTLALGLSLIMPKTYTAQATLLPLGSDRAMGGMGLGALSGALSGGLSGALAVESPSMRLTAVLQSRTVAENVASSLDLETVFGQGKEPKPTRAEVIDTFQKRVLNVRTDRGVIVVSTRWRDPDMAAAIANASVSATARFLNEHSISTSFQVLDDAIPPEKPSFPKIVLNVVIAFILSVFAALAIVFARQYVRGLREPNTLPQLPRPSVPGNGSSAG